MYVECPVQFPFSG
jgi:fused signal recognition particle receptor